MQTISRRQALQTAAAGSLLLAADTSPAAGDEPFRLNYILSSCMYGEMPLAVILPEVRKTGAESIDIWRRVHGNQREQIDEMGVDKFADMLKTHNVRMGVSTCYPLGPFNLRDEMKFVKHLGGRMVLCGSKGGPKEPAGAAAKAAVAEFLEQMKPHIAVAEELGVVIAIENHDRQLLYTPDSLRYFAELNRSRHIGVAFAPHHLYKHVPEIPGLIEDLGPNMVFFYAQEHGHGAREKLPKAEEMMQMPGFGGGLDYRPIVEAMKKASYRGPTEIFMHPVPRGIPILPTVPEITAAINKSRAYLEECVQGK